MSIVTLTAQKDTFVYSRQPWLTPCSSPVLLVGTRYAGKLFAYLFFDLSHIPPNARIKSAVLSLFPVAPQPTGFDTLIIKPLAETFEDCVTNYKNRPISLQEPGIHWTINHATRVINIDIKKMAASWLTGQLANNGLIISSSCLWGRKILAINSSNSPHLQRRPLLTLKIDRPKGCQVENIEEIVKVLPSETFSTTREVWCYSVFSLIVKNMGFSPVMITLQDSADGIDFIDEGPTCTLQPQQTKILVNRFFTRFTRLKFTLASEQKNPVKVSVFLQGRI
ncbi:DNRLRE domain-containing protein [Desulforamulus hydrothermalis]|uniref:Uncharacterized protein n=1 Tax=Desulforamulus hydrothermalis Lam5 = DSM 18033 TaxID=1121428 RepID=K8E0M9_9FIRM|nr:DNRLRE domain-containing protein [Desulforamulus hydrothermalis]CCO09055.1 conserved hypothetical protein [Desulforamulus hydrothermalis Lam5 = DSM 18033]SHG78018.1 hypothetical protein SAMN02745177_00373 [Desulforamulus hydrothermalis Lam5 = DSM 18033]